MFGPAQDRCLALLASLAVGACTVRSRELPAPVASPATAPWVRAPDPVELACDGAPAAQIYDIALPTPPATRSLASFEGSTFVSSTAELVAALEQGAPVIVLDAAAVFSPDELPPGQPYLRLKGQQLWAEVAGEVRLRFGVQAGGNGPDFAGSELHGLVFDIQDPRYAARNPSNEGQPSAIMNWGGAQDLVIEDCIIHGNGVLEFGVLARQPEALSIHRVELDGVRHFGVYASTNDATTLATPIEIHDIRIHDIYDPANDEKGCGVALGHQATVTRAHLRDIRSTGILTANHCDGALLSQLDIDRIGGPGRGPGLGGGVGVYIEHQTRNARIERFCVGPDTRIAVNSEWDHHGGDPKLAKGPRGTNTVVRHGSSAAWLFGVQFDQGTRNGTVHDVSFRNYRKAAILFYNNLSADAPWPEYDGGSIQHDNFFAERQSCACVGTCNFTRSRWNAPLICEGCEAHCSP